jgi:hypothetical protein
MIAMPTTTIGAPTGVTAKNPSGSSPAASNAPETTRLVEVPIVVSMPPRIVAKESGISRREAATPRRSAHPRTIGAAVATTGVLLTRPDSSATGGNRRSRIGRRPLPSTSSRSSRSRSSPR